MELYRSMEEFYGRQGWWPVDLEYHEEHLTDPREEIVIGAILTQNTSWRNVERALENLKRKGMLSLRAMREAELEEIQELIRPAGYYRQKSIYLKEIANFLDPVDKVETVSREELLSVKGVGKETADVILLYAGGRPFFVIDAYTKRFIKRFYGIRGSYEELRSFFESNLPIDAEIYKEFHALIDIHGKRLCKKIPECNSCFLKNSCLHFSR